MRNLSRGAIFISLLFLAFSGQAADPPNIEKIDINTASLEDLVKIIHIGEVRARELISLRPFYSLDDLTKIKGIGETRLEDIKKQGLAWVSEQLQAEPNESIIENQHQQTYPTEVVINEILPSPEGPDSDNEWIEIFNQNDFEVDLSNWQIVDTIGKTTTYAFPIGTRILSQGFLVLSRPTTKITLNNTGDKLILLQPDGKIFDTVIYEKSPQSQSYNRVHTNWLWSSTLTPGSANIVTDNTADDKQNNTATLKDTIKNEQLTASLSQIIARPKSFLFIFLIALGISIFSAIIFFFLKDKILKNNKKT